MRLALFFNPFAYKLHEENLRVVQKYFGLFPPLSQAWVAAIAERAGHEVILVDARTLRLSKDELVEIMKGFQPDIIGTMMTTYMFRETLGWIQHLKKALKVPVVVGGYNLRVYPKESVVPEEIDFGVVNSALYTVPRLLEELEGRANFDTVPGLVYKKDGQIIQTPSLPEEERFEDYPNPVRHLLPNELYAEFPTERKNFTVLVTSKGCPMGCLFCEAGRTLYNPRSPMTVVNEMEECYYKHGVREIDIFDYEFPCMRKRTLAICREIQRRKLDIHWACRSRVDSVDAELLQEMYRAGCRRIYYGIESGSQETLNETQKRITLDQVRTAIGLTREIGIKALGFFLIGAPGETKKEIARTVKFAKSLDLEYVQFSKLTAKPLTPYWRELVQRTGKDYWKEYVLGHVEEQIVPRFWTPLSDAQLDELAKWAYVKYHARPSFLLKSTLKVRSWSEFRRKVSAFLDMCFSQERTSKADPSFVAYGEVDETFRSQVRAKYLESVRKFGPKKPKAEKPAVPPGVTPLPTEEPMVSRDKAESLWLAVRAAPVASTASAETSSSPARS